MTTASDVRMGPPPARARARELGIRIGLLPPGPTNSIVDVADVRVGHATVWRDEASPPHGRGTARTGVTAIVPFDPRDLFDRPIPAGCAVLNGAGALVGLVSIGEWGVLETPVLLTSSMALGRVYDAAVEVLVGASGSDGHDGVMPIVGEPFMPVVGECDDGYLNDAHRVQVDVPDVREALRNARGAHAGSVASGVVGAGTGMRCFELKGGIGTASRVVRPFLSPPSEASTSGAGSAVYNLGVLALTNFGRLERLTVDGVAVGSMLGASRTSEEADRGSSIVVIATDAPLDHHALERLARRAGLGLARTGSFASHTSGEIFLAFSTGVRVPRRPADPLVERTTLHHAYLNEFFAAAVEATEEAVIDSLCVADTVVGRDGHRVEGLPVDRVLAMLGEHRRPPRSPRRT